MIFFNYFRWLFERTRLNFIHNSLIYKINSSVEKIQNYNTSTPKKILNAIGLITYSITLITYIVVMIVPILAIHYSKVFFGPILDLFSKLRTKHSETPNKQNILEKEEEYKKTNPGSIWSWLNFHLIKRMI